MGANQRTVNREESVSPIHSVAELNDEFIRLEIGPPMRKMQVDKRSFSKPKSARYTGSNQHFFEKMKMDLFLDRP